MKSVYLFDEQVLWPYLLQNILPVQYTKAISPLCKSLAFLATKKREEEASDYQIDFTVQGEQAVPSGSIPLQNSEVNSVGAPLPIVHHQY